MTQENSKQAPKPLRKAGLTGLLQTVFGAVFGIQSDRKRQEDFAKTDPGKLIAIGIITVIVIMVGMVILVNSILSAAAH